MSYTKLTPGMATKTQLLIQSLDILPMILGHTLTPQEAAEVRARVDALNSVLNRHIRDTEATE